MTATILMTLDLVCDSAKCRNPGGLAGQHFDLNDADGHPTRNKLRRAAVRAGWSVKTGRWFCVACTGKMRAAKLLNPG